MTHTITRDPRGSQAQLGYKVESAYGTAVTVDSFVAAVPPIGLKPRVGMMSSTARVPGRISKPLSSDVHFNEGGDGAITLEVTRSDMLKWWRWATGDAPSSAAQGGTAAYLHTFEKNMAAAMMNAAGTAMTMQVGIPMRSGAVEPFTFAGCKCMSWSVACQPNETLKATFNVDSNSSPHTTDLATPTYPATHVPFSWFDQAIVKRAGTALPGVNSVTFSVDNGLTGSDRKQFDGTGKYAEPMLSGEPSAQIELEIEPSDLSLTYDDWMSNTGRAWVIEFVSPTLAAVGYYYTFRITIADGYLQGDPPEVSGEDLLTHKLTILANDNGTDPLYKIEIINLETTV